MRSTHAGLVMEATGLGFTEGPVAHDGAILLCDIHGGVIQRVAGGKATILANVGGGPNGLAKGPGNWLYVANNGGAMRWERQGDRLVSRGFESSGYDARIERVELSTGRIERVLDGVDGRKLKAIDDLVFDGNDGFWFTDLGRDGERGRSYGGVYWTSADGLSRQEVAYPLVTGANGIGLSPDGGTLYATEYGAGRLWAWTVEGPGRLRKETGHAHGGRLVWQAPDAQLTDSLAVSPGGNIVIAVQPLGALAVVSPAGELLALLEMPESFPTNVCFDPADSGRAYVTLASTGRLAKLDWMEPGASVPGERAEAHAGAA